MKCFSSFKIKNLIAFFVLILFSLIFVFDNAYAMTTKVEYKDGQFLTIDGNVFADEGTVLPGAPYKGEISIKNSSGSPIEMCGYTKSMEENSDIDKLLEKIDLYVGNSVTKQVYYKGMISDADTVDDTVQFGMINPGDELNIEFVVTAPEDWGNIYSDSEVNLQWVFQATDLNYGEELPKLGSEYILIISTIIIVFITTLFVLFIRKTNKEEK